MHSLAVLDELPQQLGNDLIALAHLCYLKTDLWERTRCAFGLNRVPFKASNMQCWAVHREQNRGMSQLYHKD